MYASEAVGVYFAVNSTQFVLLVQCPMCILSFCDYGGVYCCEVGLYVLFCEGVWVCADACCISSVVCFLSLTVGLCIGNLCSGCDGYCAVV